MKVGLLGPVKVCTDDGAVADLSGRNLPILLAVLACHGNRPVSTDVLREALWGDAPPRGAAAGLRVYVHHLRRALGHSRIWLHGGGYALRIESGELDVEEFRVLVTEGREALASGGAKTGAATLREALGLWRGAALEGLRDVPVLSAAADRFEELRLETLEERFDAELALGRGLQLIAELQALVGRHPFREGLRGQLMVALHRAGRRADALAEYRRAGQVLRDELGIDPGPALRRLHERILTGDLPPVTVTPPPDAVPAPPDAVTPPPDAVVRCLPRTIADFTGREATVRSLLAAITGPGAVLVVDGMAGSGKTTLALHVASLVGDRYPDAHLFVDLHGHSEQQPLTTAAALVILLRQLGVPAETIPAEPVERVALWRSEVAKRRVLVVLDNAASSTQVAELLPASASSVALVTARRRLAGLDGVHLESLPVLGGEEAVALLARIVGDRVHAETAAARELVRRCGGLPLAVRLAGARLAHRPGWQVAELLRRLDESVLPQLAAEDRTVVDAFVLSYRQLPERSRRAFQLFGVYPGADFDVLTVAALTGLPLGQAQDLLEELVDVHLVDEPDTGVFRLHDLLREYAATLAGDLPASERHTALLGVFDQQMHAAAATVEPARRAELERDLRSPEPLRRDLLAALADPAARLERERPNLVALVDTATTVEPVYAWKLPRAAWRYLWYRGYIDDIAALHRRALAVAETLGDRSAAATALHYLGSVHYHRAEFDKACELVLRAIRLREELGETGAVAASMGNLAQIYRFTDRWADSMQTALTAERLARVGRRPAGSFSILNTLAYGSVHLGRYADALRYQRRWLMAAIDAHDLIRIADGLQSLAVTKHLAGLAGIETTRRQLHASLRLFQRMRTPTGEVEAHQELAKLLCLEQRYAEAVAEHRLALDGVMRLQVRTWESKFRSDFATTLRLAGDTAAARVMAEHALRIAQELRLPYLTAYAQASLAECAVATDLGESRRLWEQAREAFVRLGAPERVDVERRLAAIDQR